MVSAVFCFCQGMGMDSPDLDWFMAAREVG